MSEIIVKKTKKELLEEGRLVFAGKEYFDSENLFRDGVRIFSNRAIKQRPPELQIHYHDFVEIAYISKGSGIHEVNGEQIPVRHGDLFVINPWTRHRFLSDACYGDEDFVVCNICFDPDVLGSDPGFYKKYLLDAENLPFYGCTLPGNQIKNIEDIFWAVYSEHQMRVLGYEDALLSYLKILIIYIYRMVKGLKSPLGYEGARKSIISDAVKYIDENYSDPELTLKSVCLKFYLSRNYFSTLFRDYTSQSFSKYVQAKRITQACELLSKTDMRITDIISEVGYSDSKHFNIIFRNELKMSPSEYRKTQKHGV